MSWWNTTSKPLGVIQGGFFYKALSNPIYTVVSQVTAGKYQGLSQLAPINGPSAHIAGIEMAWQQRLSFLPGALKGMGVRAKLQLHHFACYVPQRSRRAHRSPHAAAHGSEQLEF